MLTTILFAAGAMAQTYGSAPTARPAPATRLPSATRPAPPAPATTIVPAAPAAVPGRTLRDLPGMTITYFDIAGKNGPAIEKSLQKILADPAAKDTVRLFTWDVGTQIVKATTGTKCSVKSAKSTLTAKVRLPRLVDEAKVPKNVIANWTTYIAGVENEAAANLWFLSDRLRGAEQSLVNMPCDQASAAWNSRLETVKSELNAFIAQRALPAAKPAA